MNRFEETKKAGLFGIIGNIFLLIIKGTVGFVFKSQAMIADAANSAGDIFASLMTFIGNKIATFLFSLHILFIFSKNLFIYCLLYY